MTSSFTYAVVTLDHALIWKGSFESGATPVKVKASADNPQYTKEHESRVGDRDKSVMDHGFAEHVIAELQGASHVYLVSAGSGKANAAHQLVDIIKAKHHGLADKVLEPGTADVNSLSENQLLELGRNRLESFIKSGM